MPLALIRCGRLLSWHTTHFPVLTKGGTTDEDSVHVEHLTIQSSPIRLTKPAPTATGSSQFSQIPANLFSITPAAPLPHHQRLDAPVQQNGEEAPSREAECEDAGHHGAVVTMTVTWSTGSHLIPFSLGVWRRTMHSPWRKR